MSGTQTIVEERACKFCRKVYTYRKEYADDPPSWMEDFCSILCSDSYYEKNSNYHQIRFVLESDADYQDIERENLAIMNKISEMWQRIGKSSKK